LEKLYLVIAEAALELVPEEIWSGRDVIKSAMRRGKKPSEILLDISLHYRSMRKLSEWYKRGRPDLVHTTLLVAGSSEIWRKGLVKTIIETRHGLLIIKEKTRIVRNYNRFVSLIEQVFLKGSAPPQSSDPLIRLLKKDLLDYIENDIKPDTVFIFHERGERGDIKKIIEIIINSVRPVIIIGGFQRGDFSRRLLEAPYKKISISDEILDTWAVVCRVFSQLDISLFS